MKQSEASRSDATPSSPAQPLDQPAVEAVRQLIERRWIVDAVYAQSQDRAARIITDAYAGQREELSELRDEFIEAGKKCDTAQNLAHKWHTRLTSEQAVRDKLVEALEMRSCNRWFCGRMKLHETGTELHVCERCAALTEAKKLEDGDG